MIRKPNLKAFSNLKSKLGFKINTVSGLLLLACITPMITQKIYNHNPYIAISSIIISIIVIYKSYSTFLKSYSDKIKSTFLILLCIMHLIINNVL